MVHHPADMPVEKRPHMRGGEGIIALQAAFSPQGSRLARAAVLPHHDSCRWVYRLSHP